MKSRLEPSHAPRTEPSHAPRAEPAPRRVALRSTGVERTGAETGLDGLVGYHLRRASTLMMARLQAKLTALHLSVVEASALLVIAAQPGITQSGVGEALDIQRANMAPIAAKLTGLGYARKEPVGRTTRLFPSADGKRAARAARLAMKENEALHLGALDAAERAQLRLWLRGIWQDECAAPNPRRRGVDGADDRDAGSAVLAGRLTLDRIDTPLGGFVALCDAQGRLVATGFSEEHPRLERLLARCAERGLIGGARGPARVRDALRTYFDGGPSALDGLVIAPVGTAFQREVWEALRTVAYGATISYGALALRIGRPRAVRAVGLANRDNPLAIVVPCHRVVGADGSLTGYAGGLVRKRWLLAHEAGR